ncbi:MAG: GDP-mannose 4,6-dehydratase [Pseudomonadota bacterium]
MRVLITGIGGMMGSHLTDYLSGQGIRPLGIHYNSTVPLSEIGGRATLEECDVRDALRVLRLIDDFRPQVIYHLAAQSYPSVSWLRPADTLDINIIGTVNVCEAVKLVRRVAPDYDPVILVACSSAEYGASLTPERTPISEDAPLLPLSPYGVSKVGQDLLAYQYHHCDGLRTIRTRIFNTTGPRKVGDAAGDFTRRVVEVECGKAECLRVGNLTTRRAITDVRDLIRALVLLAERGAPGEVYNISGKHVYSMKEVVDLVKTLAKVPVRVEEDASLLRPTDEPVIFGDSSRLQACTTWEQEIPLERTLSDMLEYWRGMPGEARP